MANRNVSRPRKARGAVESASFRPSRVAAVVRDHFAAAQGLPEFLESAGELTPDERRVIVRQALILIEQNYAHLPLKRAMHAVDPVQRLKLLLQVLESGPEPAQPSEIEFHREMTDIFTSVRDLHTNYLLPAPFNRMAAFLPFMIESYFDDDRKRRYLVSHVAPSLNHPTFKPGVEVLYWNGVPIERAVLNHAQRYAGSNREARHARGVATLTTRALIIAPPPDEDWVIVSYRSGSGAMQEIRFEWMVNPPLPAGHEGEITDAGSASRWALDLERDVVQRTRTALFATKAMTAQKNATAKMAKGTAFGNLESAFPTVFDARPVTTADGTFGYIRIRTFYGDGVSIDDFVNEFIRLISALPQNGLIVDVRGNGGGIILCGELILQTLTARHIDPEPCQFLNTPLNLQICRLHAVGGLNLGSWIESMQLALQTGSTFSAGFPITPPEQCNSIGQKYFGPVVLITDALCYSTTDIFAAGFQDHEIGPILGVDGNTGAGGANVWQHSLLLQALPGAQSVYKQLPKQAGMRVSIRRTLRVGKRAGMPVEDLGVVPDERHFVTKNDLLNSNADMIKTATALLKERPVRALSVTVDPVSGTQSNVTATVSGITRLDIYVDERPMHTVDVNGPQAAFTITKAEAGPMIAELRGFDGDELVARYRTEV